MNIVMIGASGKIGQEIAKEFLRKGHQLTNLSRSNKALPEGLSAVKQVEVDVQDSSALANAVRGYDAIVSAFGPALDQLDSLQTLTQTLITAAEISAVKRVVVVGGAGSLEVAPGLQLVDTPEFPAAYHALALAHREAYKLWLKSTLDWTFFAPAAYIFPGDKKGNYQIGSSQLLSDASGNSAISYADYAEAFVSVVEQNQHVKSITTVAYQ